jgi:hypothetical protein
MKPFPRSMALYHEKYGNFWSDAILQPLSALSHCEEWLADVTQRKMNCYPEVAEWRSARNICVIFMVQETAMVGPGPISVEPSRLYLGTPQSVLLLWTSDQSCVEAST